MEKKSKFIISIDLGGTNLKIATVDEKLRIVDKDILPTPSAGGSTGSSGSRQLIEGIIRSVETQIEKKRLNYKNILGLGIGVPGPVDVKKGLVYFFPNIPGCKNLKLAQILKKRLALPVYIDNDANLFALAEFLHIKDLRMQNILGITLGTGVGGGLIINGKLYRGQSLVAGEFGHIPIEINGRRCNCGGRGCI
ncbi:MAG: ROK family protein, partial [Candidatus Omnitrophica bacterium]|nr:ROK family protein [Candidatus Omnitrophota bacterium]